MYVRRDSREERNGLLHHTRFHSIPSHPVPPHPMPFRAISFRPIVAERITRERGGREDTQRDTKRDIRRDRQREARSTPIRGKIQSSAIWSFSIDLWQAERYYVVIVGDGKKREAASSSACYCTFTWYILIPRATSRQTQPKIRATINAERHATYQDETHHNGEYGI